MVHDPLLKQFMPSPAAAKAPSAKPPPRPPQKPQQKPVDRESDPAIQGARDLCSFAGEIMEDIYKDYVGAVGHWEVAFGEVLAAVAIANEMRDRTLKAVQEERAQDAAKAAFVNNLVFSVLTMGAMAYVGEFVKAGLPNLRIGKGRTDHVDSFNAPSVETYLAEKILVTNKVVLSTPVQFTQFQANVFGTIAQDAGNRFVPMAFPKPPELVPYRIDSPAGLESLRQDFNKNVKESKGLVLGEIKKVKQWLNHESEFGEAWLAFSGGSREQARSNIVRHIEQLRNGWAKRWEFFGKSPFVISRVPLAELYERAWWATHVIKALTFFPYNKEMTPESEQFAIISQLGRGNRKLLERAIVDRLRELNVVFAETHQGMMEQAKKTLQGAPRPEVSIDGAIEKDEAGEALSAYRWAKSYFGKASADAAFKHFPPAQVRPLEPLRAAHY